MPGLRMRAWIERLRAAFVVQGGGAGPVAEAPPVPMRTIVRRFWPYARRYRPWLLLTAVFITLDAAIETAAVWLFKVLVDEVLVPRDFHALVWVGGLFVAVTVAGGLVMGRYSDRVGRRRQAHDSRGCLPSRRAPGNRVRARARSRGH